MIPPRSDPPGFSPWPFRPWMSVERGEHAESIHEGVLVVVDDRGDVRMQHGDPAWTAFLRSSAKPVQAIPVVTSGAADRFGLEPRHLALCAASHGGEPFHVGAAREILRRAGADESWLRCGPHPPAHRESADDLARSGATPLRIHNNCSGKHAGMMAASAARGWDVPGYWRRDHPLQEEIAGLLGALADVEPGAIGWAIDGCGLPTWRLPVERFARAMARFVSGAGPARPWRAATARLHAAMATHPEMVGGTGRFCTEVARAAARPLLAKGGAEGFYVAAWVEDDGTGVALAAKAADGDDRSRDFVVAEVLARLGVLAADGPARLLPWHGGPIRNHAGEAVGRRVSLLPER